MKNERNLSVYTPPDYRASGQPYALLVLFDESAYLNNVPTPVILDNLIAAGKIPPMVAVLIANPSQDTRSKGCRPTRRSPISSRPNCCRGSTRTTP